MIQKLYDAIDRAIDGKNLEKQFDNYTDKFIAVSGIVGYTIDEHLDEYTIQKLLWGIPAVQYHYDSSVNKDEKTEPEVKPEVPEETSPVVPEEPTPVVKEETVNEEQTIKEPVEQVVEDTEMSSVEVMSK